VLLKHNSHTWALVLAAGEGSRLRSRTTTSPGIAIPKQFCSLFGGPSLLEEATRRAIHAAPVERVCVVVAAQHRRWWENTLEYLPGENVIVQEENRGTAHGILLSITHILVRDPDAVVAILPADHYLGDEQPLRAALCGARNLAAKSTKAVFLLGIEPDGPDIELGYIVPRAGSKRSPDKVQRFVEKPTIARAQQLLDAGALWNAFVIVALGRALLALFEKRCLETTLRMLTVARRGYNTALAAASAIRLYQQLSSIDFSRDILEGQESMLRVLRVPNCGWSDLGTPQRVAQVLRRVPSNLLAVARASSSASPVNLAVQYFRSQSDAQCETSISAQPA
jgi:mannose-1-phosphate guanylyltransferase